MPLPWGASQSRIARPHEDAKQPRACFAIASLARPDIPHDQVSQWSRKAGHVEALILYRLHWSQNMLLKRVVLFAQQKLPGLLGA